MLKPTLALLSLPLLSPVLAAQAQGLTPIQVLKLRYVSGVYDCGEHGIAFTRIIPRTADDSPGGARRQLFLLPPGAGPGEEKELIGGKASVGGVAVWEDKVTFLGRPKGAAHAEVVARSLSDGKTSRVTTTPRGVRSYKWSPDFQYIAFTALDPMPEGRARAIKAGFKQKVLDEDFLHVSLWLWQLADGKLRRLTKGKSVFGYEWAKDSSKLALAMAPRNLVDDSYMFKRIYTVDLKGKVTKLVDNPGKLGDLAWSPDGRQLAYIGGVDSRDPHAGMLYLHSLENQESHCLTPDLEGMVQHIHWQKGKRIQALISRGVKTYLCTIETPAGQIQRHAGGKGIAFTRFSWHGDHALAVGSSSRHHAEVFKVDTKNDKAERLTDSNPWLAEVALGKQEIVRYKARDGLEIEGLLLYPVGYEQGRPYPMVIVAHGGPESHFTEGWNTSYSRWGQMLCARGYFAWYPNYRSSTGYGVEFAKMDHGDPMGTEFLDHLDAIEHLAKKGLIDRARIGMGGGSYGGYAAAWAATKMTKHFAAAVSFVPFVDIRTKWYTSDISWEFYHVHYEEKLPHEQVGFLADHSPLSYAYMCRTPLLVLGGTADPRVHPSQPHMLYRAVKFSTRTPVRYVQYPGEGHGNRTNTNQYDYAVRALRWFDRYLRPGDHRMDPPPPLDLDYSAWYASKPQ